MYLNLFKVIFGTLISYLVDFNGRWNIAITGNIPLGFPVPKLPPFNIFYLIIGDCINIAIVSYALNFSIGKIFAKKYKYNLDPNQVLKL